MASSDTPILTVATETIVRDANIEGALSHFRLVRPTFWRGALVYYPILVVAVLALDALFFQGRQIVYDLVRLTGYVAVAAAAVFFIRLDNKIPETLKTIWDRGLLSDAHKSHDSENYARFITEFDHSLNSIWGWVLGGSLALLYVLLYSALVDLSFASLLRVALAIANWLLAGMAIWRLFVIGYVVSRIPVRFHVVVQPSHPDQAGGLEPIGDLCFANALVVIVPALVLAAWVLILSFPALVGNNPTFTYFQGYLQSGLIPVGMIALLGVSLITFFLPLYEIHREMVRQRIQYQERLDSLARRIDEIAQELLDPSVALDSASAQKRLDMLKWMRQVYQENNQFPTYPFNRDLALKLTFSQVVPLLTLAGLPNGLLDAFSNFTSIIQPR